MIQKVVPRRKQEFRARRNTALVLEKEPLELENNIWHVIG